MQRSEGRGGHDPRPRTDLDAFVKMLDQVGVVRSVPFGVSNDEAAELLRLYPDRFIGLARISGLHPMAGVRELEHRVRDQGFRALGVSALVDGIPASDRRYYPLYAKAAELDVPVRVYSSMNYATDRPYDLGHPRHLDQVLVGLSAGLVGQTHETLIQEYPALPLKDSVKEKWLYGNAARVFRIT